MKSIISIISCITLMASLTPAYALEANTSGSKSSTTPFLCGVSVFNKSTSEALLTAQPATFSVTVPTALPVNVDASGAVNMTSMFVNCSSLTTLDLSPFNISNVNDGGLNYMFEGCTNLTTVYARTQADADKFNASSDKPANVNVIVKA